MAPRSRRSGGEDTVCPAVPFARSAQPATGPRPVPPARFIVPASGVGYFTSRPPPTRFFFRITGAMPKASPAALATPPDRFPAPGQPERAKPQGRLLVGATGLGVQRQNRWLVRDIDLSVRAGEIVTIIGPNGAGKSTTVKALLGLTPPSAGKIDRPRDVRIGYVPQTLTVDQAMPLTVRRLMNLTGSHGRAEVSAALARVGIADLAEARVQTLSGGEFRRALLARALLRRPDLLVLDEPVQGVDFSGEIALYQLVADLRDELDCGVLMISHDLHIVMRQTDHVICLNGHVCCHGTPQRVAVDPAYLSLFGERASETLAVYPHRHDHSHDPRDEADNHGHA